MFRAQGAIGTDSDPAALAMGVPILENEDLLATRPDAKAKSREFGIPGDEVRVRWLKIIDGADS